MSSRVTAGGSLGPEPSAVAPPPSKAPRPPQAAHSRLLSPALSWFGLVWAPRLGRFAPYPTKQGWGADCGSPMGICFAPGAPVVGELSPSSGSAQALGKPSFSLSEPRRALECVACSPFGDSVGGFPRVLPH